MPSIYARLDAPLLGRMSGCHTSAGTSGSPFPERSNHGGNSRARPWGFVVIVGFVALAVANGLQNGVTSAFPAKGRHDPLLVAVINPRPVHGVNLVDFNWLVQRCHRFESGHEAGNVRAGSGDELGVILSELGNSVEPEVDDMLPVMANMPWFSRSLVPGLPRTLGRFLNPRPYPGEQGGYVGH